MLRGLVQLLGETTLAGRTLPWLAGAFVDTSLNLLLIAIVLQLQGGANFKLLEFLRSNAWATQISIFMLSVGGAFLAFAIGTYDGLGVAVFFLPILLSSYAFRLYVRQMQTHLDNLENIVAERTTDLQLRTEELADLNKQKDTYLAVLTHDMMTPLSNIQLCTEILREDDSLSPNNRELAALMLRSQRMLFGMVRNILDIEKMRVGEPLRMHKAPCDIAMLAGQMVQLLGAEAHDRQITITYEQPPRPIVALADKAQVERVLLNLMGNALKYSPTESCINVDIWEGEGEIVIEISDTGFGIPADQLPHIFNQYRRVDEHADKATGTGLGLAITQAIVGAHGGSISAESIVGKGSTFRVQLPAPAIQPQDVMDYEG